MNRLLLAFAAFVSCPLLLLGAEPAAPAAQNGWPSVSPDGKRIAFISDRTGADNVFIIGVDGSGEVQVTKDGGDHARWSADGTEIYFVGTDADTGRVMAIAPDGSNIRGVVSVAARSPILSPDGKQVIFNVGSWTSTMMFRSAVDGSSGGKIAGGNRTTAWNGAWSPDGMSVAYTHGDSTKVLQVHVVNADGTNDHAITHMTLGEGSAQVPAWSPDGKRIAFQVNSGRKGPAHIWIVDVATGKAQELGAHAKAYVDEVPSWFPDGKRLAFQSNRTGTMEIWVMNEDGSGVGRVTGREE